jgi:hypothetical protein
MDITYQRPRNMDPTNSPSTKPFRAGSYKARSARTRTWNIILLQIQTQTSLPSAGTGADINAALHADHLTAQLTQRANEVMKCGILQHHTRVK